MKRCPKCNQTFAEEWLSFCTQDGTSLIDTTALPSEPPPTMVAPMPPSVSPTEQPTLDLPGSYTTTPQQPDQPRPFTPPPSPFNQPQPYRQPQPMQGGWQPPPPPRYVNVPQQGMAVASLILGIFTITIGWCYVGVVTSPIAIILGIISLVQIKSDPTKNTGKPMAIAGIVMGALYWVLIGLFVLFAVAMQGVH